MHAPRRDHCSARLSHTSKDSGPKWTMRDEEEMWEESEVGRDTSRS